MASQQNHIALVCNPTDGNEKALRMASKISILLTGMGIRFTKFTTEWPADWKAFTEAWIVGGDGTVNWFINHSPEAELPLAVFAGGSGNDFHWMLYGDTGGIEQQVERVLQSSPKPVDAGVCNGKFFLNGLGIGFDGAIVKDLLGKKKLGGKASYLLSILKQIVGYHEKPCTFHFSSESFTQDCFMISVANGRRYGGGFLVTPQASLEDGLLDINIVGKISPVKRMKYLPVLEKGDHINLDFVRYCKADRVVIESASRLHAHLDGEYLSDSRFEIEILPKRFLFIH